MVVVIAASAAKVTRLYAMPASRIVVERASQVTAAVLTKHRQVGVIELPRRGAHLVTTVCKARPVQKGTG
jgi:hypothetical protein